MGLFDLSTQSGGNNGSPYANPFGRTNQQFIDWFLNENPVAGFYSFLNQRGLLGSDPTSRFARQRQSDYYGRYLSQAAENPTEGFYDYLLRSNPNPEDEYLRQSPDQRFDFSSRLLTPRARWVG